MNCHIQNFIICKDNFYETFVHGKISMFYLFTFNNLQNHLNRFIQKAKQILFSFDISVKQIYEKHEKTTTVFTKHEMKNLLTVCAKNVHFSFNNDTYIQIDGIEMGSPLGPVIANIFMVELESVLVPRLNDHLKNEDVLWMTPLFTSSVVH